MYDDEIIRVARRERFTILDHETVRDKRLTFCARGLLHYILSLPANWKVNLNHLVGESPAGPAALKTMTKELKKYRYMVRLRFKVAQGRFQWKTIVSERPMTDEQIRVYSNPGQLELLAFPPVVDFPLVEIPSTGEPSTGEPLTGLSTSGEPPDIRKTDQKERFSNERSKDRKTENELEPLPFSSTEFVSAWDDYEQSRREKKKSITPTARKLLCKKLLAMGEARAAAALTHSAACGYQGLFEPSGNGRRPADSKVSQSMDAVHREIARLEDERARVQ